MVTLDDGDPETGEDGGDVVYGEEEDGDEAELLPGFKFLLFLFLL